MSRRSIAAVVLVLTLAVPAMTAAQDSSWRLKIGDPARKDRDVVLVLDGILDTAAGKLLTTGELAAKLDDVKVVFIGESHTDIAFHRVQLQVIQELQKRGRDVLVGLEMYPYTQQASLDIWNQGKESENDFVAASQWYKNWGYHWQYYRDIFLLARDKGMKMYAVNTPREVVTAVRKKGFQNLTPEEAARIPSKVDTSNEEHKQLFRAFFASDDSMMHTMSGAMFDGMFAAQCTWDASMGFNAVQALKKFGGPKSVMVVLIGSGHVAYGLGIQRQAALWFDGKMASIIPVAIADSGGRPMGNVQASYADYLWGLPKEDDPVYPSLGLSTRDNKGEAPLDVIDVPKDSVAALAGFKVGDVMQAMDGTPLKSREVMNTLMAEKRWADAAVFTVVRGNQTMTLTAYFRRTLPAAATK
ncbi:MAG: ChaN family lipoprotein [Acidobacteria bacterium]|nr:ChaN family lipoprotein [Acidobacteriota bacterium]